MKALNSPGYIFPWFFLVLMLRSCVVGNCKSKDVAGRRNNKEQELEKEQREIEEQILRDLLSDLNLGDENTEIIRTSTSNIIEKIQSVKSNGRINVKSVVSEGGFATMTASSTSRDGSDAQKIMERRLTDVLQSLEKSLTQQGSPLRDATTTTTIRSLQSVRKKPCIDMMPEECVRRRNAGECYGDEDGALSPYMAKNCPWSCDICNEGLRHHPTGMLQEFSDTAMTTGTVHPDKNQHNNQREQLSQQNTTEGRARAKEERRTRHLFAEMSSYHEKGLQDPEMKSLFRICKNRHSFCLLWAKIGFCEKDPQSMAETCGPACHMCHLSGGGTLDVQVLSGLSFGTTPFLRGDLMGVFEAIEDDRIVRGWNGKSMLVTTTSSGSNTNKNNKRAPSKAASRKKQSSPLQAWHKFVKLEQFHPTVYKPEPISSSSDTNGRNHNSEDTNNKSTKGSKKVKTVYYDSEKLMNSQSRRQDEDDGLVHNMHTHNEDSPSPMLARFDRFLNEEECRYLLNLVRRQSVVDKRSPDGFGAPTTDAKLMSNGQIHVLRTSSRLFLQPAPISSSSDLSNLYDYTDELSLPRILNPMLEQILDRIELVTGVPTSHIETPIQFDKFTKGQYHEGQTHSTHKTMVEESLRTRSGKNVRTYVRNVASTASNDANADSSMIAFTSASIHEMDDPPSSSTGSKDEYDFDEDNDDDDFGDDDNPRVLGLIIFLNDIKKGQGALTFPEMGLTIPPSAGKAVLYPIVTSLEKVKREVDTTNGNLPEKMRVLKMVMENTEVKEIEWDDEDDDDDDDSDLDDVNNGELNDKNNKRRKNRKNSDDDDTNNNDSVVLESLEEDERTIIAHETVQDGVKYVVSFFMRLRPYAPLGNN